MISATVLNRCLAEKNFDTFDRIVDDHFSGHHKSNISSASKIINIISVQVFHTKDPFTKSRLESLVSKFVKGVDCIVNSTEEISADFQKKNLSYIYYVLDKGMIHHGHVDLAMKFLNDVKLFMIKFKPALGDSEEHVKYFGNLLKMTIPIKDFKTVEELINFALKFNLDIVKTESNQTYLIKQVSLVVSVLKAKISNRSLKPEGAGMLCRQMLKTFDQLYESHSLSLNCFVDSTMIRLYLIYVMYANQEWKEKSFEDFKSDFLKCCAIIDMIPGPTFSSRQHYFEAFIINTSMVVNNIRNHGGQENFSIECLEKAIQLVKTFLQTCPEKNFESAKIERIYNLLVLVLTDAKKFKDAMLTIVDAMQSTTPSAGPFFYVFKFAQVRQKAILANDPAKDIALVQIFQAKKCLPQEGLLNIAKLEMVAYHMFHKLMPCWKSLLEWIKPMSKKRTVDEAMVLIQDCWFSYYESSCEKEEENHEERCQDAIDVFTHAKDGNADCLLVYRSLANIWKFLIAWKTMICKLQARLKEYEAEVEEKLKKKRNVNNEEIDTENYMNYDAFMSWPDEDRALDNLRDALKCLEDANITRDVVISDGWLATERNVLSIVACLSVLFELAGDQKNQLRALKLLAGLSLKLHDKESRYFALFELAKAQGIQQSFKSDYMTALKEGVSEHKTDFFFLLLGLAWDRYNAGDFEKSLEICSKLMAESEVNKDTVSSRLLRTDICLAIARCRHIESSYLSDFTSQVPEYATSYHDIAIFGPFEFARKAKEAIFFSSVNEPFGLDNLLNNLRRQKLNHEVCKLNNDLFFWTGMPKQMKLATKFMLSKVADFPTIKTLVEGLLYEAEAELYFDRPDHAQVILNELRNLLKEFIGKQSDSKKVHLVLPDEEDLGASPATVRFTPDVPSWMRSHKPGCQCYPCSRPHVLISLVKFYCFQAVNYSHMSDVIGSSLMFERMETVIDLATDRIKKKSSRDIVDDEEILVACFQSLRWQIEVLGRLGNFEECQRVLSKMKDILQSMNATTLRKFPVLMTCYLDLACSLEDAFENRTWFASKTFALSPLPKDHGIDQTDFKTPAPRKSISQNLPVAPIKKPSFPFLVEEISALNLEDSETEAKHDTSKGRETSANPPKTRIAGKGKKKELAPLPERKSARSKRN